MPSKSVLIVEDDEPIVEFLRLVLEDLNHRVLVARNGPEGLDRARAWCPDLILLDLSLPVFDGWELVRRLKIDPTTQSIPVIAVSGASRIRGGGEGGDNLDAYVAKPFEVAELEDTLRPFLIGA